MHNMRMSGNSKGAAASSGAKELHSVAIDLLYIPDVLHQHTIPFLNILDLGTNYQMIEVLQSKDPAHIWHSFWNVRGRPFGMPQYVAVDEGREFRGAFTRLCAVAGIVTFRIAARGLGNKEEWNDTEVS